MGTISLVIPQIGQPDTTEDVKVQNAFTTIQTVINGNLDTTNIAPLGGIVSLTKRAVTANTAAVTGQWIECGGTPPYTITLPAAAANAIVAVSASLAVTGASPITVSGGASSLAGVGLSATSMALGTPNSYVVLVCDGSSWVTIAGQQDTGWVALSLAASFTVANSATPQYRLTGDFVRLRGECTNGSGGTLSQPFGVTWPAVINPSQDTPLNVIFNVTAPATALIRGGSFAVNSGVLAGQSLSIAGVSYSL